jgi:hypothetical protein
MAPRLARPGVFVFEILFQTAISLCRRLPLGRMRGMPGLPEPCPEFASCRRRPGCCGCTSRTRRVLLSVRWSDNPESRREGDRYDSNDNVHVVLPVLATQGCATRGVSQLSNLKLPTARSLFNGPES